MKAIDSMWFNTIQGSFGFVVGENEEGKRNLYAGACIGLDQAADKKTILDWGNKVNIPMLLGLLGKTRRADGTRIAIVLTGFSETRYPGTKDEQRLVQEVT